MQTDSFTLHFSALKDQRQSAKVHYPLFDLLFLTLCAVMTEGWEDFGVHRLDRLQKRGFFKHGIPVHDTIARVISQLEPALLLQCFIDWMCDVSSRTEGEMVAIDGKTLRGSWQPGNRSSAIHMVSAFACSSSLVLGQVKSNEIRAIPELLRLLEIKGCLISIDAMDSQKQIAQQIIEQKGDYLLAVKGNQGRLRSVLDKSFQAYESIERQETEQQKSRLEGRSYQVLSAVVLPEDIREQWPMLKTIALASSYRMTKDQDPSYERRYFIKSAELDVDQFANAGRS